MTLALVTGSGGLIGSEATEFLCSRGVEVVGVDNDMRQYFFGNEASTLWRTGELRKRYKEYSHESVDIRDSREVSRLISRLGKALRWVIHCAAQPSHDWAARDPILDFDINARATLNLLEAVRLNSPEAAFVFMSTNKVYGDRPNELPFVEQEKRWELAPSHEYALRGIPETMSIDQTIHSVFGASKVAADVMVQEYGRYFGMQTACFRGGCLSGGGHSGAELHGFLAYLMKCTVIGRPYTIFGYGGKQVRDNIHSSDLVNALWAFLQRPRPAAVYNIGGSRLANCSVLEAIQLCQNISGRMLTVNYSDVARKGDHIWWISDISKFTTDYPEFELKYGLEDTLRDIFEVGRERWSKEAA